MEKRIAIGLKLDPAVLRALDAYVDRIGFGATRTAAIEQAILDMLEERASHDDLKSSLMRSLGLDPDNPERRARHRRTDDR